MRRWSLREARSRFSALADLEQAEAPTFADLLLAIPRDDGEFERIPLRPRPLYSR